MAWRSGQRGNQRGVDFASSRHPPLAPQDPDFAEGFYDRRQPSAHPIERAATGACSSNARLEAASNGRKYRRPRRRIFPEWLARICSILRFSALAGVIFFLRYMDIKRELAEVATGHVSKATFAHLVWILVASFEILRLARKVHRAMLTLTYTESGRRELFWIALTISIFAHFFGVLWSAYLAAGD